MDTPRHRLQMELLIRSLDEWQRDHPDSYIGGDMFLYFNVEHLKTFRGPDVFIVLDVPAVERKSWVVWQEGKGPDLIIELLSESTQQTDKEEKKLIYRDQLRVGEYYWFDPYNAKDFAGFRLVDGDYQPIPADLNKRLTSHRMGLLLAPWTGTYGRTHATWLRWARLDGRLLPLPEEAQATRAEQEHRRAEQESQRAEQERQRAERLAEQLRALGITPQGD